MASIVQHGKRFRAYICVRGVRESEIFETKTEAKNWAIRRELELKDESNKTAKITVRELATRWVKRYHTRPNIDWETKKLNKILSCWLGDLALTDFDKTQAAKWRDERLSQVQVGTVLREWNILSAMFSNATEEMGLLDKNPLKSLKRPEQPPARDRIASPAEMEKLELRAITRKAGRVALQMFKFGVQTGMSAGEIAALTYDQIDFNKRIIKLPTFKTRPARDVPLTKAALELIGNIESSGPVFSIRKTSNLDANWRDLCAAAGVEDLHFHDSRHMAATWMATKIDSLALAKLLGHRNLRQLLNTYYKADASSLVQKLDE
jgi:integrase